MSSTEGFDLKAPGAGFPYGVNPTVTSPVPPVSSIAPVQPAPQLRVFEDQAPAPSQQVISKVRLSILIGMILLLLLISLVVEKTARWVDIVAILCFLPAVGAFAWAHLPKQRAVSALEKLFDVFISGWLFLLPIAFVGALVVCAVALVVIILVVRLLHLNQVAWLGMLAFTCAICASLVIAEETVKWFFVTRGDKFSSENPKRFVMYSAFSALGMATGESYFLSLFIRRVYDLGAKAEAHIRAQNTPPPYSYYRQRAPAPTIPPDLAGADDVIIMVFFCLLVIIPMHVLAGYQLGLGVARRDVLRLNLATYKIVLSPIIFRFSFTYMIFVMPYWVGSPWIALVALIIVPIYVFVVKSEERGMPNSYLRRAGYLNAFGFGELPSEDEERDESDAAFPSSSSDFSSHNTAHGEI